MSVEWNLVPDSPKNIEETRERCRQLVRRRAAYSAGMSAVPLPGLDVVSDVGMFKKLVDDVNNAFGLSKAQIDALHPNHKLIVYKVAVGVGGVMVGKLVTRELLLQVFKCIGVRWSAKSISRFVPVAGQMAAAAIGFAMFKKLGYEHVEACARVASELTTIRAS